MRFVTEKNAPLLSVAAVEVVPLLHFITKVVDAVALTPLDGSMVPKSSVPGAVVTLHVPEIFAFTVRGVVPPAWTPLDTSKPAETAAQMSMLTRDCFKAAFILLFPCWFVNCGCRNPIAGCIPCSKAQLACQVVAWHIVAASCSNVEKPILLLIRPPSKTYKVSCAAELTQGAR